MLSKTIFIAIFLCTITHSRCFPKLKKFSVIQDSHANVYSSAGASVEHFESLPQPQGQHQAENQRNSNEDDSNSSEDQEQQNVYTSLKQRSSKTGYKLQNKDGMQHQGMQHQGMQYQGMQHQGMQHQGYPGQGMHQHLQNQNNQRPESQYNQRSQTHQDSSYKSKTQRVYHGSEEFQGRFVVNQQRSRCHPNCPVPDSDSKEYQSMNPENTLGRAYAPYGK